MTAVGGGGGSGGVGSTTTGGGDGGGDGGVCTTGVRRGTETAGGGSTLTVGGGGSGGLLLIGAAGGLGAVWLTSTGVTAVVLRCCSQTTVSPSDATSAATNRAAGSIELRCRRPRGPAPFSSPIGMAPESSSISPSVRSRSQFGAGMNTGVAPSSAAGLTSRRRSSSQVAQASMCRAMRLRIRTLNWPSQPSRIVASSAHRSGLVRTPRDTSSAPRARSTVSRSRCTIVLALLWLTPSASARSGPSRPWR